MGTRIRKSPDHVFELFCEVGVPSTCNDSAWVAWKFPFKSKDEETLKMVPEFAYPVEFNDNAVHHFSFVLTNVDSKWTFGFCRHAPSSPACLVILSYLPWHETFYRILNLTAELSNRGKTCNSTELGSFLEALYKCPLPDPGMELHVQHGENKEFVASCPDHSKLPSIPENRNMTEYFNAIDAHNMMTIFASMLHERRILIVSKKLSRLSACVQAANALIYPMHWQHIFIPVLPKHLLDYLNAPMPFLIGVPALTFSRMKLSDIGDIVLLDADNNKVESPYADLDALPSEVLQSLRHDLKRPHEMLGDGVARAFLRASVKLFGGYWNALKLKQGEKISFSPELFVQTRPAPMQPFLEKMLQLQIFQQFIESRLKMLNSGRGVSDEFEFELTAHEDKASTRLRNQYRDWVSNMKKEGGAFFKNVRIKVKDTGKKAYKDIRSRIHEMHHHKIVEEDSSRNFRKRGSSVPSLLMNGLDLPQPVPHGNLKQDLFSKELTQKLKDEQSKKLFAMSETGDAASSSDKSGPLSDSPALTFKPIDMDLMGDLHDVIFRRCSLYGDQSQQRTSISDPQLIDLTTDGGMIECASSCSSRSSSQNMDSKNSTPPPLLPRPPTARTSKNLLSPAKSIQKFSLSADKPLIELDSEESSNPITMSREFSALRDGRGDVSNSCAYNISSLTNHFKNTLPTEKLCSVSSGSPGVRSTNPFHQSSINSALFSSNKVMSGPSVRNMINLWQSSNSESICFSSPNNGDMKTDIPKVIPYRSQPLSRTVSTPPSAFSKVPFSHANMHSATSISVSKNPFITSSNAHTDFSDSSGKLNSSNSSSASWENFQ